MRPQGGSINLFTAGIIEIVMESPEKGGGGCQFYYAIDVETNQGDRTGDERHQGLQTVPGHGEVFESLALANEIMTVHVHRRGTRNVLSIETHQDRPQ